MTERSAYLSVIIPMYNEEANVSRLYKQLRRVLIQQKFSYEIICVDDGSSDGTFRELCNLALCDPCLRVIQLRRNFGQTAAMAAGADQSTGQVIVFMDGDLQNDPADIPRLLAKLDEGYDIVSGWRKNRQDALFSRQLPSKIANWLIAKVTGIYLHDYGCSLKAYRWDVFRHLRLYGEMHRYLPAYAALAGASIAEIKVIHHPRQFGVSKYGISRTVHVLLDLLILKFFDKYSTKPLYAFGKLGLGAIGMGVGLTALSLGQRIFTRRPLIPAGELLWLVRCVEFGSQSVMLGIIAEIAMRTYYESQHKLPYIVRSVLPPTLVDAAQQNHDRLVPLHGGDA